MGEHLTSRVGPIVDTACTHCGDPCGTLPIFHDGHHFCCTGCQSVYQILHENGLERFYQLDAAAGRPQRVSQAGEYAWLEIEKLAERFIRYRDAERSHAVFELPSIHCASCIWLLEQLPRLLPGVLSCTVDFSRRNATIVFAHNEVSLRALAETLTAIGYPPHTRENSQGEKKAGHQLLFRIGVAGFAFGNIMLLSFPEYLGLAADAGAGAVGKAMSYLLLVLSLPVMFYSGQVFLAAAYHGLRARQLTIDVPIALGMVALFTRSVYEIVSAAGAGYLDSLAGLVFFLLIGRWFQKYTFARLSFDRDYRDYFPVAAQRLEPDGSTSPVATEDLKAGDRLLIRPGQLIPTDGKLLARAAAGIDYSFVTGEAEPQPAAEGQEVFAGGRALESPLEMTVTKASSQSYLLQLWRRDSEQKDGAEVAPSERLTRYFTLLVLTLATATFGYWCFIDLSLAFRASTAVLIIACPCALALAAPFTYGTLQRLLANRGLYLRGPAVIEKMAAVTTFIFDKTGTLVRAGGKAAVEVLSDDFDRERPVFFQMVKQSDHPRSRAILAALGDRGTPLVGDGFGHIQEVVGQGISLVHQAKKYQIGRASFCGLSPDLPGTYGCVDGQPIFLLPQGGEALRTGVGSLLTALGKQFRVFLLSGDHPPKTEKWTNYFPAKNLYFRQSPFDKQNLVEALRLEGETVIMLGDGLNDAGALAAANIGIAVSEDEARFSPACDGILAADRLGELGGLYKVAKRAKWVLWLAYGIAFLYNVIGLSYAVTGTLSPVIAAILMPLSSITIVVIGVVGATLVFRTTK